MEREVQPPRPKLEFDSEFMHKLEYLNVVARKILAGSLRADRRSIRKGSSAEFADHRAYVAGDDPRHVDWHLFGRLEEVFLKLYREEENLHLTVLVDTSDSMNLGRQHKLNHALRLSAAMAYIGMANMDTAQVVPFSDRMHTPSGHMKGKAKLRRMLDKLGEIEPSGITHMDQALSEYAKRERRRGVIYVISDFLDLDGFRQGLDLLAKSRHDVNILHVLDDMDMRPNIRGDLRLVDSETKQVRDVTVTDNMLDRYEEAIQDHVQSVKSYCTKKEIAYFAAPTGKPFDDLVLSLLRGGGLVR